VAVRFGNFDALALSLVGLIAVATACAPNDEKVSNRSGFANNAAEVDARFGDHAFEYSRSMLIELADVARQAESVLQAVEDTNGVTPPPADSGPTAPPPVEPAGPAALRATACKVLKLNLGATSTLKFETEFKKCTEKGATFEGTQVGREVSSAKVLQAVDQAGKTLNYASSLRVRGQALKLNLKPNNNAKDSLNVDGSRFLEAELVSETNGQRTYRFEYESNATYKLDLKSMNDNGSIDTTMRGLLIFDVATRKLVAFKTAEPDDQIVIKVTSGRQGKGGGKIASQEFVAKGTTAELGLNLGACALPVGKLQTRFTVGPVEEKKFVVDSTKEVQSTDDSIIDMAKIGQMKAAVTTKLCTSDQQITMTQFFAGLLY
jgi:hypothetical protein